MQRKNDLGEKIIAIIVLFSMAFLHILPICSNISFAADNVETVRVKGYFSTKENEEQTDINCDIQEENLKINFEIDVTGKGYLRSGIFKFGNDLNFNFKDREKEKIKNGEIRVPYINKGKSEKYSIPIEFSPKKAYEEDYFEKNNKITFTGIFVDNNGKEHNIEKTIDLKLAWKQENKTKLETNIIKNIDYQKDGVKGKIFQFAIKLSADGKENIIPIKNSNIQIKIPEIAGMTYSDSNVELDKLSFTQGREDNEIIAENVGYTVDNGYLNISAKNADTENINTSKGEDIYIVTIFYEGEETPEKEVKTEINATIKNYSGFEENVKIEENYDLSSSIGGIVTYERENKDTKISKGYLVADSQTEKYEIKYSKKEILHINRSDLISTVEIVDKDDFFTDESGNYYATKVNENINSTYKELEVSKDSIEKILGKDGKIEILNMNDELISSISVDSEIDENGNIKVEFENPISEIKIRTSAPIADGMISIISQKAIKRLDYSKDQIKKFTVLKNISQGYVNYKDGRTDDLGTKESKIELIPTKTEATIEFGQKELSTLVKNENVNIQIKLNNNEDYSDLYENPVFEIRLPQAIKEVTIRNSDMFYANNELQISNIETLKDGEINVIRITLSGIQSSYNMNKETNGTIISLDADLVVDEFIGNISEIAQMYYINSGVSSYVNEVPKGMILESKEEINGLSTAEIFYKGPEELVMGQATETKEEIKADNKEDISNNRVSTVKQGIDQELLEESVDSKLATMYISMINNTNKKYSNFEILGRIPFEGNKNIQTGEDLGTTVNTILSSEIKTDYADLDYKVYYSENGEATKDLENPENGWNQDFYKTGNIKSYLIVLNNEYVFEPGDSIEFMYDYVIPANLKEGDSFYGIYNTYYSEVDNENTSELAPSKIGYETEKKANLEVEMNLNGEIKEISDSRLEFNIKNNSDIVGKNIKIVIPKNEIISIIDIVGDGVTGYYDDKIVTLEIPTVEANSELDFTLELRTMKKIEGQDTIKFSAEISGDNIEPNKIETEEYTVIENKFEIKSSFAPTEIEIGKENKGYYEIQNTDDKIYENIVIFKKFDDEFSIISAEANSSADYSIEVNKEKNEIKWIIKEFKPGDYISAQYVFEMKKPNNNISINKANINTNCNLGNGEEINTIDVVKYGQPLITIESLNSIETGFAKNGADIEYKYKVTNNSSVDAIGMQLDLNLKGNGTIETLDIYNDEFNKGEVIKGDFTSCSVNTLGNDVKYITVRVHVDEDGSRIHI